MQPTEKSPAIDNLLQALTGRNRIECITNHTCTTCGGPAESFLDNLSIKEYTISGMCQSCQDSVFGTPDSTESINI